MARDRIRTKPAGLAPLPAPQAGADNFEQLSDNPRWVEQIRDVYEGDLERVDLQVGLYAEAPPPGFGSSDTAFRAGRNPFAQWDRV